jgi:hypothetical protein
LAARRRCGTLLRVKLLPILSCALLLSGALATTAAAAAVPTDIQVPAGNKQFLSTHAAGVQIYGCDGTAWTLSGPQALLVNELGFPIIHHFTGPTWQHLDGSSVVGRLDKGVTVDPKAIPWLRLVAKSTTPGRFGSTLTRTTYIQRINTRGGLAPAAATCTPATAGAKKEVFYTADYLFWRAAA